MGTVSNSIQGKTGKRKNIRNKTMIIMILIKKNLHIIFSAIVYFSKRNSYMILFEKFKSV